MSESKSRGGCFTTILAVIGALTLLMLFANAFDGAAPSTTATSTTPVIDVTATELHQMFAANEVAAKYRFDQKRVRVNGLVDVVEIDITGSPVVQLFAGKRYDYVLATFSRADMAMLAPVQKGQELTVLCAGVTKALGTPFLRDCVIEN
jgi:hypothetical protein